MNAWIERVKCKLSALRERDPYFGYEGASDHLYQLRLPLSESELAAFERKYSVQLPAEYRRFLAEIGNGGPGPGTGLQSLGHYDGHDLLQHDSGRLARPFPLTESFYFDKNSSTDEWWAERGRYLLDGTLLIADYGCNIFAILIVSGARTGEVWVNDSAHDLGIVEYGDHHLMQDEFTARKVSFTFAEWYELWLDQGLVWDPD